MKLNGIPVVASRYLCEMAIVGWKKNHRKARINKKWHKKYGPILKCRNTNITIVRGNLFMSQGQILVCPCMFEKLKSLMPIPQKGRVSNV